MPCYLVIAWEQLTRIHPDSDTLLLGIFFWLLLFGMFFWLLLFGIFFWLLLFDIFFLLLLFGIFFWLLLLAEGGTTSPGLPTHTEPQCSHTCRRMKNYDKLLPAMLEDGVRVMIYAGDRDLICNWLGNRRWVDLLQWSGAQAWADAVDRDWKVASADAGSVRQAGALTFVQVRRLLFICSSVHLFVCSFVRLSICSFVHLFICSFVRLPWHYVRSKSGLCCSFEAAFGYATSYQLPVAMPTKPAMHSAV
jgi:Serine carboxypeptidase